MRNKGLLQIYFRYFSSPLMKDTLEPRLQIVSSIPHSWWLLVHSSASLLRDFSWSWIFLARYIQISYTANTPNISSFEETVIQFQLAHITGCYCLLLKKLYQFHCWVHVIYLFLVIFLLFYVDVVVPGLDCYISMESKLSQQTYSLK